MFFHPRQSIMEVVVYIPILQEELLVLVVAHQTFVELPMQTMIV